MPEQNINESLNIPWLSTLESGDRITTRVPYTEGTYYDLFEEKVYHSRDERVGDLRYYVYDPVKHGYPAEGTYPVLYAFHGAGASLHGITAINWSGMELFASPEYQQRMGGAYIIVPLANEYSTEQGTQNTWMTPDETQPSLQDYPESIREELCRIYGEKRLGLLSLLGRDSIYTQSLIELYRQERACMPFAGKTIVFGTSAGGYCAWRYILRCPPDAAVIMAGAYRPSEKELDEIGKAGYPLWICHGQHDELVSFEFNILPILEKLKSMPNVSLYLPKLVRVPDGCVYSNPAGIEMGQHCINNAVQCDLMFEDGTPMDPLHPKGVTGQIRALCRG